VYNIFKNRNFSALLQLDNYEILPKKYLGVCVSQSNCRLFVGSIPKTKTKSEIFEEFDAITRNSLTIIG